MSRILNGDKLISSIRKRSMIPDDTSVFTDQDILDVVNEEIDVNILDKLLTLHEEHLTTHIDVPRNSKGVYNIPYRAVGNKLRDISLVRGDEVYELAQIGIGELSDYYSDNSATSSAAYKFYVENNQIKLLNPNVVHDKVRIYFYIRPNVITKLNRAGKIVGIVTSGNNRVFTLDTFPNNFNSTTVFDIVGFRTPNKIKEFDLPQVNINAVTKTITIDNSSLINADDIIIGDYVCMAEESPFPNMPTEFHPLIAQLASINILESTGDTEALNNAEKRKELMQKAVMSIVDDRVELSPKKIKPRHGTLSQAISTIGRSKRSR